MPPPIKRNRSNVLREVKVPPSRGPNASEVREAARRMDAATRKRLGEAISAAHEEKAGALDPDLVGQAAERPHDGALPSDVRERATALLESALPVSNAPDSFVTAQPSFHSMAIAAGAGNTTPSGRML